MTSTEYLKAQQLAIMLMESAFGQAVEHNVVAENRTASCYELCCAVTDRLQMAVIRRERRKAACSQKEKPQLTGVQLCMTL